MPVRSSTNDICPASPETPASSRRHQQHGSHGFGNSSISSGARTAASRLAKVGAPCVVTGGTAVDLSPHDVVGRVNGAVAIEVARQAEASRQCVHRVLVEDRGVIAVEYPGPVQ